LGTSIINHFLPEQLLHHFKIDKILELEGERTEDNYFEIHLTEKNVLPVGYLKLDYESKGFSSTTRIQDFPIRGKAVYLVIKRRRWRHKSTKEQITSDYSFIAEGSKLTRELSDFLKGTGRDPRRYH